MGHHFTWMFSASSRADSFNGASLLIQQFSLLSLDSVVFVPGLITAVFIAEFRSGCFLAWFRLCYILSLLLISLLCEELYNQLPYCLFSQ